jgi:branched-chain amino acid transport system permease protein
VTPLSWLDFYEFSLIGLALGGLYALIGLGFVLIYKATRALNFAMGDFMMMGAYFYFTASVLFGLPLWLSVLAALACSALLALAVERLVLRPLVGQPTIAIVMATIGLASVLHGFAVMIWGADQWSVENIVPRAPFFVGDAMIPGQLVWGFALSGAVITGFLLYFRFARGGVALRAIATDAHTAMSVGVDAPKGYALAWVLAALTATLAGIMVGAMTQVAPTLSMVGLSVIVVVILGGLDSVIGAILAGLLVGWIESLSVAVFGSGVRDVVPYAVILLIMMIRPFGLFGTPDIERP